MRKNPTQQLNTLLKLVGLSIIKSETKAPGQTKRHTYTLDADTLARIQGVAHLRADQSVRDAWKKILEGRDSDDAWLAKGRPKVAAATDTVKKKTKVLTAKGKLLASMFDVDTNTSG